jgi:hypothetical protein
MKKLSMTIELFLKYDFKGDGKYYLVEKGSANYKNTSFGNFFRRNEECVDIVEKGNDAPRGGKTGEYLIVRFNSYFNQKYDKYIQNIENISIAKRMKQERIFEEIKNLGDQTILLSDYFIKHPDFKNKIIDRINNYPSDKWRNWVRMKVADKITNSRFDLLTLSAADIRNITFK